MNEVPQVLVCPQCHSVLEFAAESVACPCGSSCFRLQKGVYCNQTLQIPFVSEMTVRDKAADGYLLHGKFPAQQAVFAQWLQQALRGQSTPVVLDLGCGPGPYTRQLQEAGCRTLAIDFSAVSLAINAGYCQSVAHAGSSTFIQADLNDLCLQPHSVDMVVMADFLQHLGSRALRERLLQQAFAALKPGGRFCLSFFNLNIKNFFRGNVHGEFTHGRIRYERLTLPNVKAAFPDNIVVEQVRPLNIFHNPGLDALAATLPGARFIARMLFIAGSAKPL